MKLEIAHVDTCLSCYWSGHHKAHIQIPVWYGMTFKQIKDSIREEIRMGAVAGNDDLAFLLSSDFVGEEREKDADKATKAVYAAINRMKPAKKGQRRFFLDLEKEIPDDCDEYVSAFFVIQEEV